MPKNLTIGRVAKLTGVAPTTIRYYEQVGILPPPHRSPSRYRLYSETDVRRLELIRRARLLDMSLPEVQELVEWASSETCNDFQDRFVEVVRRKLEEVEIRIADLSRLKQDLHRLEAHLGATGTEAPADHNMLACSPETCTCLGDSAENQNLKQEVMQWLDNPELKK
jgi:DNA-binding transcriptional MerR regulator